MTKKSKVQFREATSPRNHLWRIRSAADTFRKGIWRVQPPQALDQSLSDFAFQLQLFPAKKWPTPAPVFSYDRVESCPDFTTIDLPIEAAVVSDRFKQFLERHDPNCAEFFPIEVDGPKRATIHTTYWFAQWKNEWDCQPNAEKSELDSALVPAGSTIGRVKGRGCWYGGAIICDTQFKRALEQCEFVGIRFEKCHQLSAPLELVRYHDRATGKIRRVERQSLPTSPCFDVSAFLREFPGGSYTSPTPGSNAVIDYATVLGLLEGVKVRTLEALLKEGYDPNEANGQPNISPLPVTIQPKSVAVIRLLHKYGADWSVSNSAAVTPLMVGVCEGPETVRLLLKYGVNPAARDSSGQNALHFLCEDVAHGHITSAQEFEESCGLLVKAGASQSVRDARGRNPLDILDEAMSKDAKQSRRLKAFRAKLLKVCEARVAGKARQARSRSG